MERVHQRSLASALLAVPAALVSGKQRPVGPSSFNKSTARGFSAVLRSSFATTLQWLFVGPTTMRDCNAAALQERFWSARFSKG